MGRIWPRGHSMLTPALVQTELNFIEKSNYYSLSPLPSAQDSWGAKGEGARPFILKVGDNKTLQSKLCV